MSKKLTPEFVALRTKCDRLESIKNLNLWGNDLEDVSVLKQMFNLEVVSLSVNKIRTLKDFSYLRSLRELYLRKNSISDINEIKYLVNNQNLRILWLSENPVADTKNYRSIVIKLLPQITKLDDNVITMEEREGYQNEKAASNEDNTWNNEEEENLSGKSDGEENVFETNNLNNDANRERERGREYSNSNSREVRDNSPYNEIYSNNEKNKKIKDKFVGYNNVNPSAYKDNNAIIQNRKHSGIINDESSNYVQNFEKININKNENLNNKNYKRNFTYEANNDNNYDYFAKPKNTPQVQKSNIVNSNNNILSNNNLNPSGRSSNVLNCVLMLLRELNDSELEIVKNDIERKISKY